MKREHRNRTAPQDGLNGQGDALPELAQRLKVPTPGGRKRRRGRLAGSSKAPSQLPIDPATRHARLAMSAARKVATVARSGDEAAHDAAGLRVCKHLLASLDSPDVADTRRRRGGIAGGITSELMPQETPAQAWARFRTGVSRTGASRTGASRTGVSRACQSGSAEDSQGNGARPNSGPDAHQSPPAFGVPREDQPAREDVRVGGARSMANRDNRGQSRDHRDGRPRDQRGGTPGDGTAPVQISLALF